MRRREHRCGGIKGAVWWWKILPTWGGAYDIAGTCRTPEPAAPAECTLTGEVSTGRSCVHEWHSCRDGNYYGISCIPQSIGGRVLTLCTCTINGVKSAPTFAGDAVCNPTSIVDLDEQAQANCGWAVTTTDLAQGL